MLYGRRRTNERKKTKKKQKIHCLYQCAVEKETECFCQSKKKRRKRRRKHSNHAMK